MIKHFNNFLPESSITDFVIEKNKYLVRFLISFDQVLAWNLKYLYYVSKIECLNARNLFTLLGLITLVLQNFVFIINYIQKQFRSLNLESLTFE